MSQNPLLNHVGLPKFKTIDADHVEEAVSFLQQEADRLLEYYESYEGETTWEAVMAPLDKLDYHFQQCFGPVAHLMGVKNSPELRGAYEKVIPTIVNIGLRVEQNTKLYGLMTKLAAEAKLTAVQTRILESKIKDAQHSGVALSGEQKERFAEISKRLSQLATTFSNNVLDATKAFEIVVEDKSELEGLPVSFLEQASISYKKAHEKDSSPEKGPWRLTLDIPSYLPVLKFAQNASLRETLYRARIALASAGDFNNQALMQEILQLRVEKAQLLGFKTFAEFSLDSKMAPSVEDVYKFLLEIRTAAKTPAQEELQLLNDFARSEGLLSQDISPWDFTFIAEKYREKKLQMNEEETRKYFQYPNVLQGLFDITRKAFGVRVEEDTASVEVWNPDVKYYKVIDETSQQQVAAFFLDPYARPENKRGGAWMNECISRRHKGGDDLEVPVAYLICNGTPPLNQKPSLMTFSEVKTLFHEFGHGLQHMLTTVNFPQAAGIHGVEWDAVELPSQFMENWCYYRDTLMGMSAHVDTGEPLPEDLYQKLQSERTFLEAYQTLRQLTFALTDMDLHHKFDPHSKRSMFDVYQEVAKETSLLTPLPEDRFLCTFGHIFAGGYSAGYYSYKWAEVLSADAFEAFEEQGLDKPETIVEQGRKFRDTVLALGGGKHPLEVFKDFRGREPRIDALLKQAGLAKRSA